MINYINNHFASFKGLIRLLLAYAESITGTIKDFQKVDYSKVDRLVFICLGNICRSPFAEVIAKQNNLPCSGFGLSTSTGAEAFGLAKSTALKFNIDLTHHRTTDITDFEFKEKDLLITMEIRHARRLKKLLGGSDAQIVLLGNWAKPSRPHIHDPHAHDEVYFENCFRIIKQATENLVKDYLAAKSNKS